MKIYELKPTTSQKSFYGKAIIQKVPELKDLTIYYSSKEYIDNIPKRIKQLKKLYKKAYEKQQELDAICSDYNNLCVGSIKNIYKDKHIYPNMDI